MNNDEADQVTEMITKDLQNPDRPEEIGRTKYQYEESGCFYLCLPVCVCMYVKLCSNFGYVNVRYGISKMYFKP